MGEQPPGDVTQALNALRKGDPQAAEQLLSLVYSELRAIASRKMARVPPSDTLQPTALVHEAYVRLMGKSYLDLKDRKHFFATAARAMRDILVEQARRHTAQKRGGGAKRVSMDGAEIAIEEQGHDLLALDEALTTLEQSDKVSAEVVSLRFFSGLTGDETAALLGISASTVDRHWKYAKAWLRRAMTGPAN